MEESVLSCDSKQHIRHGKLGIFRGLIGIALLVSEPKSFKKSYEQTLKSFFKQAKKYQKRKVYKSTEIGSLFPGRRAKVLSAYRRLARSIFCIPNVDVNVYYFTLDLTELRRRVTEEDAEKEKELEEKGVEAEIITIYGEKGREGAELVSITEFFKKIREYFPIICAWKLCSYLKLKNIQVVLDGCKGERSHAWEELVSVCEKVNIAFGGDSYNPFISAADMLVKWIDEELRESGLPLNQGALVRVLKEWQKVTKDIDTEHIHIVHLSNKDLRDIQPLSKERIDSFEHIFAKHPIFFIFREERNKAQRVEIENSPKMDKIVNLIYENDGSLIWWEPSLHTKLIKKGDVAIVFGNKGMKEAQFLISAEYPLSVIKAGDM